MKTQFDAIPCWSTTANGENTSNFAMESSALREHLHHCKKRHGGLYSLVCAADAMHGFAASRFVTTLVAVAMLILVSSLVM